MNINKRKKLLLFLGLTIILLSGISYAYFEGAFISGNITDNVVDLTAEHIAENEVTVSYDNNNNMINIPSLDINKANAGTDMNYILKFVVSNLVSSKHSITIKWKNVVNTFCRYRDYTYACTNDSSDIYSRDELLFSLYECNADDYATITGDTVDETCTIVSEYIDNAVPLTGEEPTLHAGPRIILEGNEDNYYVAKVTIVNLESPQDYLDGGELSMKLSVELMNGWNGSDCTNGSDLLNCKIIESYPAIPDSKSSEFLQARTGVDFTTSASPINGHGLYENVKNNGDGMYKYFRGVDMCSIVAHTTQTACNNAGGIWYSLNNYVSFAGIVWRILRINEDGSIRMMTNTTHTGATAVYSTTTPYVGYTINRTLGKLGTSSNAKTIIDNWYINNLLSYEDKLAIGSYCNDTSLTGTTYNALARIATNKQPNFICPKTTQNFGGEYFLKIGILSADEFLYAGGKYTAGTAFTNYASIKRPLYYWTMTPYNATYLYYYDYASSNYGLSYIAYTSGSLYLYPVVTLKNNIIVSSGVGTIASPWIVE